MKSLPMLKQIQPEKFKLVTSCESVIASPSLFSPHGLLSILCYKTV